MTGGEPKRFDPSHPETNGMIDYFTSRLSGVQTRYSISDIEAFRADAGMSFRKAPAGIVTGEVGEAVIRFGGRVFSDIGNANASVQLPMSSVLGSEKWRNLIIEVERRVEGMESYEQRRELNGVRLIYRITF